MGKALGPWQSRRETQAQIANFNDWAAALEAKGYPSGQIELSLGQRAEVKLVADAITRQRNRESVAWLSIEQANLDQSKKAEETLPPDYDWIDKFWRIAENISNENVQSFFGLVLARKTLSGSCFSMRTLDVISTLSGDEARDLERLAQFVVRTTTSDIEAAYAIICSISFEGDDLKPLMYAISAQLRSIHEPLRQRHFGSIGVFVEDGWAAPINQKIRDDQIEFYVADQKIRVTSVEGSIRPARHADGCYDIGSGVELSPLGVELVSMLKAKVSAAHLDVLRAGFEAKGLRMDIVYDEH
ncbi:DUF2806 domain-containing protein [Mesorhizobium sp. M1050]|uniref:DUF2806 domain-containing protein n=1 Tax=Mesorhizobium sp. M1050 TaxID=2957051 RepID=UPI00333C6E41